MRHSGRHQECSRFHSTSHFAVVFVFLLAQTHRCYKNAKVIFQSVLEPMIFLVMVMATEISLIHFCDRDSFAIFLAPFRSSMEFVSIQIPKLCEKVFVRDCE